MVGNMTVLEFLGMVVVLAGFAGSLGYMVYRAITDYWYDEPAKIVTDDRFEEVKSISRKLVLLSGDKITIGDKAYDMKSGEIVSYCGQDERGAICVRFVNPSEVNCYHCNFEQLIKVAE